MVSRHVCKCLFVAMLVAACHTLMCGRKLRLFSPFVNFRFHATRLHIFWPHRIEWQCTWMQCMCGARVYCAIVCNDLMCAKNGMCFLFVVLDVWISHCTVVAFVVLFALLFTLNTQTWQLEIFIWIFLPKEGVWSVICIGTSKTSKFRVEKSFTKSLFV